MKPEKMTSPIVDRLTEKSIKNVQDLLQEALKLQMIHEKDVELDFLVKHLKSALHIVDGSRRKVYAETRRKQMEAGTWSIKGSKLDKHHDRIVEALEAKVYKKVLAKELNVDRATLYNYLEKHDLKGKPKRRVPK